MMIRFTSGLVAALAFASPALAHPGHGGTEGQTAIHYLIEPLHLPLALGVLAVAAGLIGVASYVFRPPQRGGGVGCSGGDGAAEAHEKRR